MSVRHYRDLLVWQKAMDLATRCYEATREFPREELYGLTLQIRKAASSIPSNIAEGKARGGDKEFQYFLRVARGSLAELETLLEISHRTGLLHPELLASLMSLADEIGRMLWGLQRPGSTR